MAKTARRSDVLPRMLSFAGAKRVLGMFADQLRRTSGDQVHTLIAAVTARPNRATRKKTTTKKTSAIDGATASCA